jgi:hypothetical protein
MTRTKVPVCSNTVHQDKQGSAEGSEILWQGLARCRGKASQYQAPKHTQDLQAVMDQT